MTRKTISRVERVEATYEDQGLTTLHIGRSYGEVPDESRWIRSQLQT